MGNWQCNYANIRQRLVNIVCIVDLLSTWFDKLDYQLDLVAKEKNTLV